MAPLQFFPSSFSNYNTMYDLSSREWAIFWRLYFMSWRMSLNHFGALLLWWNDWEAILIVIRMACMLNYLDYPRYAWTLDFSFTLLSAEQLSIYWHSSVGVCSAYQGKQIRFGHTCGLCSLILYDSLSSFVKWQGFQDLQLVKMLPYIVLFS
jgi:hypothetical protein